MAGEDGQEYNDERQQQANPYVQESQEAVESSSKASYSLSSAQTSSAWGSEDGPEALGRKASEMFNGISDVLSKENALIAEFETKMRQAMTAIKETEADNERSFQTVNGTLQDLAGSEQAQALASSLEKAGFKPKEQPPASSSQAPAASGSAATSGGTTPPPNVPTQGQQSQI